MRIRMFIACGLAAAALSLGGGRAMAAASASTPNCSFLKLSGSDAPLGRVCTTTDGVTGVPANDQISYYYGGVLASTTNSSAELQQHAKGIGDFLYRILNKKHFTAVVTMVPSVQAGASAVLPEIPLFSLKRDDSGSVTVASETTLLTNNQEIPPFALSGQSAQVNFTFKVYVSDQQDVDITTFTSTANNLLQGLGVQGGALSIFTQGPLNTVAVQMQQLIGRYLSSATTVVIHTPLDFLQPGAATALTFESYPGASGATAAFTMGMRAVARPSLITTLTKTNAHGQVVPDLNQLSVQTWANRIVVKGDKRLDKWLSDTGVPQKLSGLAPPATGDAGAAASAANSACQALMDALRGTDYFSLSDTDVALVSYQVLSANKVMSRFKPGETPCVDGMRAIWTDRFGLSVDSGPPPVVAARDVPYKPDMEARLKNLAVAWKSPEVVRTTLWPYQFLDHVDVSLAPGFSPAADGIYGASGDATVGSGLLSTNLASRQATCLGAFAKTGKNSALALGRFDGLADLYALVLDFASSADWDAGQGPRIGKVVIRTATDDDKKTAGRSDCAS